MSRPTTATASYNADVYVFAVGTAREPALYDALGTQWEQRPTAGLSVDRPV